MVNGLLKNNGIIIRTPTKNEASLKRTHDPIHEQPKTIHKDFRNNLKEHIIETNWPEVLDGMRVIYLQDKHNEGLCNSRVNGPLSKRLSNHAPYRISNNMLKFLVKEDIKAIWTRRLKRSHGYYRPPHLLLRNRR